MDNKEREVLIHINSNEEVNHGRLEKGPSSFPKKENISLKRLVSGVLNFSGQPEEYQNEATKSLLDKNVPHLDKAPETENERRKSGKVKKAEKPPRPPKGPIMDAGDMKLLKELTRIAKCKQERVERLKALKEMKVEKASPASSSSSPSSGATILAMSLTGFFFLVLILQGKKLVK